MRKRYKVTLEQWDEMLIDQVGRCGLCGNPMKDPVVDHDHQTGKIRGLLHRGCNVGLTCIENKVFLENALAYLAR